MVRRRGPFALCFLHLPDTMTPAFSLCRLWLAALALGGAAATAAQTPPLPASAPVVPAAQPPATAALELSEDGHLVIDKRSKLAWARCAEGMQWNGTTCTGQRQLFDRTQALARAKLRAQQDGMRWRLPRAAELRRLVDKQANPPGLPKALFPASPGSWHWSGTITIQNYSNNPYHYGNMAESSASSGSRMSTQEAWAVDVETGTARGDMPRSSRLALRLVRPYIPEAVPEAAANDAKPEAAAKP